MEHSTPSIQSPFSSSSSSVGRLNGAHDDSIRVRVETNARLGKAFQQLKAEQKKRSEEIKEETKEYEGQT